MQAWCRRIRLLRVVCERIIKQPRFACGMRRGTGNTLTEKKLAFRAQMLRDARYIMT